MSNYLITEPYDGSRARVIASGKDARASRTRQRGSRHRGLCRPQLGGAMRTLAYLALLQNFVRIQALKMALIGATIIMLTEGSSMAATITVHARHETHRYDGRRPMIKLVVKQEPYHCRRSNLIDRVPAGSSFTPSTTRMT